MFWWYIQVSPPRWVEELQRRVPQSKNWHLGEAAQQRRKVGSAQSPLKLLPRIAAPRWPFPVFLPVARPAFRLGDSKNP
jgi:hypothetical protein